MATINYNETTLKVYRFYWKDMAEGVYYRKADVDKLIESLKASHYADSVDAGMRERRLRRALWLARALRARDIQRWWLSVTLAPITERACRVWNNIEIKCLKKAEEYK